MIESKAPYIFKYPLLDRALHFDFLRLRCGSEEAFHKAVAAIRPDRAPDHPRTFVAMSEWDAVVILPCRELYPQLLNTFYNTYSIDSKIAGSAGYFAYLWAHKLNAALDDSLNRMEVSGVAFVISLRFEDWVRRELGLGAEILFCDALADAVDGENVSAIVAHTFGWNDIVVVLHAIPGQEQLLLETLSRIRFMTIKDILPKGASLEPFQDHLGVPLFAASYTHLIGGYEALIQGRLGIGALAQRVAAATLLVRVTPPLEWPVREEIAKLTNGAITTSKMPTEMGHYSFSADITQLLRENDGHNAMQLLSDLRTYIGKETMTQLSSYAETTTVFRFEDPVKPEEELRSAVPDEELERDIQRVKDLMSELPDRLKGRVSPMTVYRFATVLTTLLDHLSDPIRSSVVRHLIRFVAVVTDITDLDRQDLEDLCQICEHATLQATDGIAQFQHDANSLGLTGRGGYSRLIAAIENYVDDIFASFDLFDRNFLITFGLRLGHAGSVGRFHIDVPFNVLFVPSRWYILFHEVGHIAWGKKFGWMPESLAVFDEMEREVPLVSEEAATRSRLKVRAEFVRTREIIRELFPNLLVFRIACGGKLEEFDRLSLRHILSRSRPGKGTRELLISVVLHCILELGEAKRRENKAWLSAFLESLPADELKAKVQLAIVAVAHALEMPPDEIVSDHLKATIPNKTTLLVSSPFFESVKESVESVLRVLRFTADALTKEESLGTHVFADFENSIEEMITDQETAAEWAAEGFAEWIARGEVLAVSPGAHVWGKLLLASERDIRCSGEKSAFMVSQLSALLSIWHRAVTSVGKAKDEASVRVLNEHLYPLKLATLKVFSAPAPASEAPAAQSEEDTPTFTNQ